jgi:TonB family protein
VARSLTVAVPGLVPLTGAPAAVLAALLLSALLLSAPAAAQDPPPPDTPNEISVPRGAAGAVLKEEKPSPPPDQGGITMPKPVNYVAPEYPEEARKAGIEGQVVLALDIDREGHVKKAVVVEPGGHGFDEAAVEAAKKLQFTPARKADGTAFAARIRYRYGFTLTPAQRPPPPAPGTPASEEQKAATFSGLVLAFGSEATIAGATVDLEGRPARTDENGAFLFAAVPAGKYKVTISAPGYEPLQLDEDLAPGERREVKYRLLPKAVGLEVTVKGDRPPREVTKRTLEEAEIEKIPGTNGDALKSIQNLPGVARPPGILGVLIVRGSAPQDTQTFVDGTLVPLIYHFGGLSSVVPTEILDKIDFYPGNFGSEYGRAMGGIVDVGLRSPKTEYHGLAQMDLIDARLMFEGPIPGTDGWTFLVAGRRSYIDAWLGPVLKGLGAGVTQAPVYYDYQMMLGKKIGSDSNFRVLFFGSDDDFKILLEKPSPGQPALSGQTELHTAFQRLQMRYARGADDGDRTAAVLAFGQDQIDFGLGTLFGTLALRTVSGRVEYGKKLARWIKLDAGLDVYGGYYDVDLRFPAPPIPGQPQSQPFGTGTVTENHLTGGLLQPAAYLEAEMTPLSRLRIVPGIRFDWFNIDRQFDVSPRVNARLDIVRDFPRTTLKGGVGIYAQPPQFQEVAPPLGNPNLKSEVSFQYALGVEQQITRQLDVSLEGFYKRLEDQVVASASRSGQQIVYSNDGTGYVVGGELLLKYKPDKRFFGWLAYTLSRSTRVDGPGQAEHLAPFDQTHILTVLGSYKLGHGWELGARFRLVSGNLVTPNVCDPTSPGCDPSRTNALFNAAAGTYVPIPLTGPATERLPLFQQLDVRVDKTWKLKKWTFSMYLDVQNVYNYGNAEAISYNYNFTGRQYVAGLPILPSIGARGEF